MVHKINIGKKTPENTNNHHDKKNSSNSNMDSMTDNGVYFIKNQCIQMMHKSQKFFDDAKVYEKFNKMMKFMLANPILLVGFIIISAIFIIPILLFTFFAIINVAIAFTSFIIIQVMLILIGITAISCVLFFIVSAVVLVSVAFILAFYVAYFTFEVVRKKIHTVNNLTVSKD